VNEATYEDILQNWLTLQVTESGIAEFMWFQQDSTHTHFAFSVKNILTFYLSSGLVVNQQTNLLLLFGSKRLAFIPNMTPSKQCHMGFHKKEHMSIRLQDS
jgi:hypothetical protein